MPCGCSQWPQPQHIRLPYGNKFSYTVCVLFNKKKATVLECMHQAIIYTEDKDFDIQKLEEKKQAKNKQS